MACEELKSAYESAMAQVHTAEAGVQSADANLSAAQWAYAAAIAAEIACAFTVETVVGFAACEAAAVAAAMSASEWVESATIGLELAKGQLEDAKAKAEAAAEAYNNCCQKGKR